MSTARIINEHGEVEYVERPSTEELLDLMMEQDRKRANNLLHDLTRRALLTP
jgi:hypothetical protein